MVHLVVLIFPCLRADHCDIGTLITRIISVEMISLSPGCHNLPVDFCLGVEGTPEICHLHINMSSNTVVVFPIVHRLPKKNSNIRNERPPLEESKASKRLPM